MWKTNWEAAGQNLKRKLRMPRPDSALYYALAEHVHFRRYYLM